MIDFAHEKNRFESDCTACGQCVTVCPIIPFTGIKDDDPGRIMAAVLDVFRHGRSNDVANMRIYSCMSCLTCRPECPEDLDPSLGLSLARGILREAGEPMPRGLSFLLPETGFNLMKAIEAIQIKPEERPWITDVRSDDVTETDTVIFTGCTGIMQPDLVMTARDLVRRADPTVQVLGGVDYCCGDTNLRAGNPEAAKDHFYRLVDALDRFSPKNVLLLCPTCKAFFDLYQPDTDWSWRFITEFLAEHLDKLGRPEETVATVTIHDACHLTRGKHPDLESPRKLLEAIPGIEIIEMKNSRETTLCCGGSAMAAVGKPGLDFRSKRLEEAQETGAEIMAVYCPGCQSVFVPEMAKLPIRIESIIKLLGRSVGVFHEDKLLRFMSYRDAGKVLSEAGGCIEMSELPKEKLTGFASKYFK
ncbi:MAG: (Fe-S)-binding protein [Deltaproteobacteria bacterium]|nr:(Fe-S)-binding protein [Deltaproteobacteria bacterium]